MPEETSKLIAVCDFITKYSIYAAVFLLPILFLPWTSDVLDFNKQLVLVFLSFLALFAWMIKTIVTKKFSLNPSRIHIAVGVLFIVYFISTLLSLSKYGSFWGWPQVVSDSLLTIIGLSILYFLVSNIFGKQKISKLAIILCISGLLALIYGFFQVAGVFILPFSFSKSLFFNTIGNTATALGFFTIVLLPLFFYYATQKKRTRFALYLAIVFAVALLVVLNYAALWWLAIICSALIIIFGVQKRDYFNSWMLILPMFFLVVSLFFVILKPHIGILPPSPVEIYLNQKASLDIASQTLKSNPIFGSGPGTFSYDFLKYKNADFNKSSLWSLGFGSAASKILTDMAATGILGFLAILAIIASVIFYGIKYFFIDKKIDDSHWPLAISIFISFLVLSAGFFLFPGNVTLDFLFFFLAAAFIAITSAGHKEYRTESSAKMSVAVVFIIMLCFVFGLGFLVLTGQKYAAEAYYVSGSAQWQAGNADQGLNSITEAVNLNPSSDLYFTQLARMYLSKLMQTVSDKSLSKDQLAKNVQSFSANAVNAAQAATNVNPKNINNWAIRGYIYQNLIGLVPDAGNWAIKSYDEAIKLDANDPYYPLQESNAYLQEALALTQDKQADKPGLLTKAKDQVQKAIQLKVDYSAAYSQLATLDQANGDTSQAIKDLEGAKQSVSNDPSLFFQLGLLYYQSGDYKNAEADLQSAVVLYPNYSNALYFLGLADYQLGQKDQALQEISKVASLNPDNDTVKQVLSNLNAGKDPLAGIGQTTTPPVAGTPDTNTPPTKGTPETNNPAVKGTTDTNNPPADGTPAK